MKHIIFNLTDCFELTNVCTSNLFAHENETAELRINTNVKDNYVYYLHKKQNGKKDFVKLEKTESYLYYPLNSAFLNQSGKAQLQLRAVFDEDKAIESNPIELYIHDFINASNEPTPQQASVIEKLFNEANDLLIDAQELKEKADTLESLDVIEIENGVAISYDEKQFNIYNGKDGLDGEQGPEGPKGETGETGPRGPEGPRGPMGIQGPTGPRGETGPKGDRGAEGPRGPVGPMGVQGPKGSDGAPGPTGKDGKTPIKGVDYWTTEDIVEMTSDVKMQVEPEIQEAISIAKGANRAHVFNTYNDMMAWLAVEEHKKDLIPGDNLYLRDLDVPDYWWDGVEPQMLETQKVDLSDYATKEELGGKQNKLVAGENITINPVTNEISATGGGGGSMTYAEVAERLYNNDTVLTDEQQMKIETWLGLSENYLTYYNETPYQVNDNYIPAHKKYVDESIDTLNDKVDDLQLFKFPNATIIGEPTINHGQISDFSSTSYLKFPFLVDFQNRPFIINMEFTTGSNVTNQENIFDSDFGLAFAIRSGKFVIAISSNGTSWNLGEGVGTHSVQPNTTYRVKFHWDRMTYYLEYSTDGGKNYTTDITKVAAYQPAPKQIYIGVGENFATVFNNFSGIINMNHADLTVNGELVWSGMDDVGLATRLEVDMSNIDPDGRKFINGMIADYISTLDGREVEY